MSDVTPSAASLPAAPLPATPMLKLRASFIDRLLARVGRGLGVLFMAMAVFLGLAILRVVVIGKPKMADDEGSLFWIATLALTIVFFLWARRRPFGVRKSALHLFDDHYAVGNGTHMFASPFDKLRKLEIRAFDGSAAGGALAGQNQCSEGSKSQDPEPLHPCRPSAALASHRHFGLKFPILPVLAARAASAKLARRRDGTQRRRYARCPGVDTCRALRLEKLELNGGANSTMRISVGFGDFAEPKFTNLGGYLLVNQFVHVVISIEVVISVIIDPLPKLARAAWCGRHDIDHAPGQGLCGRPPQVAQLHPYRVRDVNAVVPTF